MQVLSSTDAQALAIDSLNWSKAPRTADIMAELVRRNELLKSLLAEYQAIWFHQTGKIGYECSFCRQMIDQGRNFCRPEFHAEDCPLPDAVAAVEGISLSTSDEAAQMDMFPGGDDLPLFTQK